MSVVELGGPTPEMLDAEREQRRAFFRRHRQENDRFLSFEETLSAYQEFVKLTGPAVLTNEPSTWSAARACAYCGHNTYSPGGQCRNCGAARGI